MLPHHYVTVAVLILLLAAIVRASEWVDSKLRDRRHARRELRRRVNRYGNGRIPYDREAA